MGHIRDGLRFQAIESRLDALEGKVESAACHRIQHDLEAMKQPEPEEEEWQAVYEDATNNSLSWRAASSASMALAKLVVQERTRAANLQWAHKEISSQCRKERDEARDTICSMLRALEASQMSAASPQICVQTCENVKQEADRYKASFEELVESIRTSRKGSIGSIDSHYMGEISRTWLDALEKRARGEA